MLGRLGRAARLGADAHAVQARARAGLLALLGDRPRGGSGLGGVAEEGAIVGESGDEVGECGLAGEEESGNNDDGGLAKVAGIEVDEERNGDHSGRHGVVPTRRVI